MSHAGIEADRYKRFVNKQAVASSPFLELCEYCDGTGNEFYAMYRACPRCGGEGVIEVEPGDA